MSAKDVQKGLRAMEALGIDTTPTETKIATPVDQGPSVPEIIEAEEAAAAAPKPSFWESLKASFRVDNTASDIYRALSEPDHRPYDSTFKIREYLSENQERLDSLTLGDQEEIGEILGEAMNANHAEELLGRLEREQADEQLLMEAGVSALVPRLIASIADPVDIAVTAATLPISGGASAAVKLGKTGRIVTQALTAAGAAGATEGVLAKNSPFRDSTDVGYAVAGGLVLGGFLSSLTRTENELLQKAANDLANGHIDDAARRLGVDSAGAARVVHRSDDATKPPLAPRSAKTADEILDEGDAPEFGFQRVQQALHNFQSRLFYGTERTRKLASSMLEGGWLKDKFKTRRFSAEGRADLIRRTFLTGMYGDTEDLFKAWAKERGIGNIRRVNSTSAGEEFYSEVGLAMRGLTDGVSPQALEAAQRVRPYMDNMWELAERAGVKGFDKEALTDYFPRMVSHEKFSKMYTQVGHQGMVRYYREAILSGNEDMTEELAEKIAKNYVMTIRRAVAGIDQDLIHGIRIDDMDRLRELFADNPEVDELIEAVEAWKLQRNSNAGKVRYAKSRIRFDESFEAPVQTLDGETLGLRFVDLLENDARKVLGRYSQVVSGHIGMAQESGIASRADFEAVKRSIISEVEENGGDLGAAQKEVAALDQAYRLVLGQTIETDPNSSFSQVARSATGLTYILRGTQFGVAALAEIGNTVGTATVRDMVQAVPEFGRWISRAVKGDLEPELANTVELMFAPGVNRLTGQPIRSFDDLGEGFTTQTRTGRVLGAVDPYIKSGGRLTSNLGLNQVTDLTQRWHSRNWLRKMANLANGNRKLSKGQISRLRANGIDEAMQNRIFDQLRTAGVYRNKRLIDIDVEKWTDDEAFDAFRMAGHREMRAGIQEPDIANTGAYMESPLGRMVFQFMRFPMDAVNKQTLRGLHHADAETLKTWTATMGTTALVYTSWVSLEYANNPEKRAEMLTPEKIAAAAFMRSGFSSLIPPMWDNAMWAAQLDPVFSHGRTSGLGTNLATSNPVVTTAKDAILAVSGVANSLLRDDYEFSQQDLRRIEHLIPFHRLLGIKNALHAIEQEFPEKSKSN